MMLEKVNLRKKMDKSKYQAELPKLAARMGELQRELRALNIPVIVVFEGFGAAGKGLQIGRLIQSLDPRGFQVWAVKEETEEESMHPFLWRFWTKIPAKGRIAIFDGSWYRKVLIERFDKKTKKKEVQPAYQSICSFEKQLTDDGYVLVKLLLDIDKKEQKRRFDKLKASKETAWRVTKGDLARNEKFAEYSQMMEDMLHTTDTDYAPWTMIESTDRYFAEIKIYTIVIQAMEERLQKLEAETKAAQAEASASRAETLASRSEASAARTETLASQAETLAVPGKKGKNKEKKNNDKKNDDKKNDDQKLRESILAKANLKKKLTKEQYAGKLDKLQKKISLLHNELYRRKIPLIIGFEGWDAGGKGGAIRRLTEKMDPRGFVVNPTAAPNDIEKAHHYLWRFWRAVPKAGHIAIFDRTWYGRVMVERIEGLCTKAEWNRAYKEINDMEKDFADKGAIVLKFWMQIDKDEQKKRFTARQENPDKQWKITGEDWRNREKWDQYEEAVNEMLLRTSTKYAPWIVVEGNDKYFARIKVLETVVNEIEARLKAK